MRNKLLTWNGLTRWLTTAIPVQKLQIAVGAREKLTITLVNFCYTEPSTELSRAGIGPLQLGVMLVHRLIAINPLYLSLYLFFVIFSHLDSRSSQGFSTVGYFCPQCKSKYCELPIECKACGEFPQDLYFNFVY